MAPYRVAGGRGSTLAEVKRPIWREYVRVGPKRHPAGPLRKLAPAPPPPESWRSAVHAQPGVTVEMCVSDVHDAPGQPTRQPPTAWSRCPFGGEDRPNLGRRRPRLGILLDPKAPQQPSTIAATDRSQRECFPAITCSSSASPPDAEPRAMAAFSDHADHHRWSTVTLHSRSRRRAIERVAAMLNTVRKQTNQPYTRKRQRQEGPEQGQTQNVSTSVGPRNDAEPDAPGSRRGAGPAPHS